MISSRAERLLLLLVVLLAATPGVAFAYPWMIQHQYTTCSQCHVDPSGGSALTPYGRAQTETLLRSRYGGEPVGDPGPVKDFLFGAIPLPDAVIAQGDIRGLLIPRPDAPRLILMQADLRGGIDTGRFVAYGSVGVVSEGARAARILSEEGRTDEIVTPVSRDWWLGVRATRSLTIRAGRMNLPFGIRSEQHILFTRAITRTTTNDDQQLGVAAAVEARRWRGELMGIAGNLSVSPDAFRERGYSGYLAASLSNRLELGVSSLVAGAQADVVSRLPTTRQAHGVFSRAVPLGRLALLGEVDLLATSTRADDGSRTTTGLVLDVQGDWEAVRGVHLKGGAEVCDPAFATPGSSVRGWGAVQWFFAPHVDLRVDALQGRLDCEAQEAGRFMALLQLHAFL